MFACAYSGERLPVIGSVSLTAGALRLTVSGIRKASCCRQRRGRISALSLSSAWAARWDDEAVFVHAGGSVVRRQRDDQAWRDNSGWLVGFTGDIDYDFLSVLAI